MLIVLGALAKAEGARVDASALACTAAYQLDWEATTSLERSAADREGAEKTYEALRASAKLDADALNAAIAQHRAELKAQISSGSAGLTEIVEACDKAWSGAASDYAAQYAPPAALSSTSETDVVTFENTEPQSTDFAPSSANSSNCETTDRRASGIMDTWTYALKDYYAEGVYDYAQERELSELYRNLRSRLEDEGSTAQTYGCYSLASDIRHALSNWENPF